MALEIIDFRSDTVTKPSPEMRDAMRNAEVGDDVYGEDPTVNELQRLAAQMTGKEAALLVSSGTMGNLVALLTHCGRGDEAILGHLSHIHIHEQGGVAALGSIHPRIIPNNPDGTLNIKDILASVNEDDAHCARSKLICLENTWHGNVVPLAHMQEIKSIASEHHLSVHLDGARVFNAATALNVDVKEITKHVDSVQFCLSKGLASPVGSMLCGTTEFIRGAHRMRKLVGGGTRQAGVLAACGLISLKTMTKRLHEDHANAQRLAKQLEKFSEIEVLPPQTNMVFVKSKFPNMTNEQLVERLKEQGILVFAEPIGIRFVTHYGLETDHMDAVADRFSTIFGRVGTASH